MAASGSSDVEIMARIVFFFAVSMSLLAGCASKSQSSPAVEAAEAQEQSTGDESRSRYRGLEGSSGFSAEEAERQLGGY